MPPQDDAPAHADAARPTRRSGWISIDREFLRSGVFAKLSHVETSTFLQIVWNGPVRAGRIMGGSGRAVRRALACLVAANLVRRGEHGFVPIPDWESCGNYLWVEPLRYGWISRPARILLIFLTEWTRGRQHCYHSGIEPAVEAILGLKRSQYRDLFAELQANRLVEKTWGRVWTMANAPQEVRKALRMRDDYLYPPSKQRQHPEEAEVPEKAGALEEPRGPSEPRTGAEPVRGQEPDHLRTGAGPFEDRNRTQGSPSGVSSGDTSWTHSPQGKGEGEREGRAETWLRVYMESHGINGKYGTALRNEYYQPKYKEVLDGLPLWHWCLTLYLLRGDDTKSWKSFLEGNSFERIIEKAHSHIEKYSDPETLPDLLERLQDSIDSQADLFTPDEQASIRERFDFYLCRPGRGLMKNSAYECAHGLITREQFESWKAKWEYGSEADEALAGYLREIEGERRAKAQREQSLRDALAKMAAERSQTPPPRNPEATRELHRVMAELESKDAAEMEARRKSWRASGGS